jgi:EPS-associated MarR family transcriptional regulator
VHREPNISIAEISRQLGVSNGMAHYLLRRLIDKGSVKVKNLSKTPNKRNYSYILTPTSLSRKLKLTSVFLELKRKEYHALRQEIRTLEQNIKLDDSSSKNSQMRPLPADFRQPFGAL